MYFYYMQFLDFVGLQVFYNNIKTYYKSLLGNANGIASLDVSARLPESQLTLLKTVNNESLIGEGNIDLLGCDCESITNDEIDLLFGIKNPLTNLDYVVWPNQMSKDNPPTFPIYNDKIMFAGFCNDWASQHPTWNGNNLVATYQYGNEPNLPNSGGFYDRVNLQQINDISSVPDGFYLISAWWDTDYSGTLTLNGTESIIENMWATTGGPTISLSNQLTNVPCSWCLKIGDCVLSMNESAYGGFGTTDTNIGTPMALIDDLKQTYPEIQTYSDARHAAYLAMVQNLDPSVSVSSPDNDKRIDEASIPIPEIVRPYNELFYGIDGKMTLPHRLYVYSMSDNNYLVYMNAIYINTEADPNKEVNNEWIRDGRYDYVACTESGSFTYVYEYDNNGNAAKSLIVEAKDVEEQVTDTDTGELITVPHTEITYHLNDGSTPPIIFAYSVLNE